MGNIKIEYASVESISPYEDNSKIHTEEQIGQIKESIKKFGFNDPIAVWGEGNTVIEGNGRLQAAKELGMKEVPIIHLDTLSDAQRRAYGLVHNRTTMNTGFDFSKLSKELGELNTDFDMTSLGFSNFEVSFEHDLQAQLERKQARETASTAGSTAAEEPQPQNVETPQQAKEAEKKFEREWMLTGTNPEKTSIVCEIACNSEEEIEWLKSVLHQKRLNQIYRCCDLMRKY